MLPFLSKTKTMGVCEYVTIHHVAVWTSDPERLRDFYTTYFGARCGEPYRNKKTGFFSYFLSFDSGAFLEIMHSSEIPPSADDPEKQRLGLIHLAFSAGSKAAVDALTQRLVSDGYTLLSGPRWTGDGYYESCLYDPDSNRIEITV